jgi:molybdenum cofactor biosynthesis enzyme MoaA
MDLIKKHIISVCFTTQCNYNCEYCVSPKIFEKTFIDINKLYIFIQNILCYTEIL